jgi:hypothetical protein
MLNWLNGKAFGDRCVLAGVLVVVALAWAGGMQGRAQEAPAVVASGFQAAMREYRVRVLDKTSLGAVPTVEIYRNGQLMFRLPLVSGLASEAASEHLSQIQYSVHASDSPDSAASGVAHAGYEIVATAKSSLWTKREFHWKLLADHIEFQQMAWGEGKVGRCYFFSQGRPGRWDKGLSDGPAWNTTVLADRYMSPAPNHANQWEFSIGEPQLLGFGGGSRAGSEEDFRPAQMGDLFSPPPLMLAFHRDGEWASVGMGTEPGKYRFPALEYSGSRYAGAAFSVDYLGYQAIHETGGEFRSPVAALHFAYSALDTLELYTQWLRKSGFATEASFPDAAWHHLPVFCGWAEQTTRAVPQDRAPNTEATQKNYEAWAEELTRRKLPVGTIVIDDKWQKGYGSFDIDREKFPDLKAFVAGQHAKGRHVLLWVPLAHSDGLPEALCLKVGGKCVGADVGNPAYETFLRGQIRYLVETVGVDGFKEDWVNAPSVAGLSLAPEVIGIEYVRRFQHILYSEAHRWKPDALIETQTTNAAFRDSSDVLRLNDVWYATRDVVGMMRQRARIAHISGWELVDTDNASSTTLATWWDYMEAQPSIGIPALYFLHRTESTLEEPAQWQWDALGGIWRGYIDGLPKQAEASRP